MIREELRGLLLLPDDRWCQVYEDIHVIYHVGKTLEITVFQGAPPEGTAIEEAQASLPEGFELNLTGNKKGFSLKRLSASGTKETVAEIGEYLVSVDDRNTVTALEQRGKLYGKHIWGSGERFHAVDLKNSASSGSVTEKFTRQGEHTYLPVPFFCTEQGTGCFKDSCIPVQMDFTDGFVTRQETTGKELAHDLWFFGSPAEILYQFIRYTGKPALPPDWAFGVWISANGWNSDAEVNAQLAALEKYDYPADVMVLEAWSDERTFYCWNGPEYWKDPRRTVQGIKKAGLHPVLWQIPVIKKEHDGEPGAQLLEDEREAIERRYCIFREDGTPYRIPEGVWFSGSLLPDFTNPETVEWWFSKRRYLLEMGIEGFKTDGGEFLLDDSVRLYNGLSGKEAHNLYPGQYISAYHDFMEILKRGQKRAQDKSDVDVASRTLVINPANADENMKNHTN